MNNRFVVPFTIILLFVCLTFAGAGWYQKIFTKDDTENVKKTENYLSLYDNDVLKGKYVCESSTCKEATTTLDENNILQHTNSNEQLGVINGDYVFIRDINIKLYQISTNKVIASFSQVQSYDKKHKYIIVKDLNEKYGLIDKASMEYILDLEYDFIELSDNSHNKMLVVKDEKYFILDLKKELLTEKYKNKIIYFDDNYFVINDGSVFKIGDYDKKEYLTNYEITKFLSIDDYFFIKSKNIVLVYKNTFDNFVKRYNTFGKEYDFVLEEDKVKIYLDGEYINESYPEGSLDNVESSGDEDE